MFSQKPKQPSKHSFPNITKQQTSKASDDFQYHHDNYINQLSTEFPTINVEDIFPRHVNAILHQLQKDHEEVTSLLDGKNNGLMTSLLQQLET